MPIVEPHLYADTPIFREMLYEREGRFPGTPKGRGPEGPEDLPIAVTTPVEPSGDAGGRLLPVPLNKAVIPVQPIESKA